VEKNSSAEWGGVARPDHKKKFRNAWNLAQLARHALIAMHLVSDGVRQGIGKNGIRGLLAVGKRQAPVKSLVEFWRNKRERFVYVGLVAKRHAVALGNSCNGEAAPFEFCANMSELHNLSLGRIGGEQVSPSAAAG